MGVLGFICCFGSSMCSGHRHGGRLLSLARLYTHTRLVGAAARFHVVLPSGCLEHSAQPLLLSPPVCSTAAVILHRDNIPHACCRLLGPPPSPCGAQQTTPPRCGPQRTRPPPAAAASCPRGAAAPFLAARQSPSSLLPAPSRQMPRLMGGDQISHPGAALPHSAPHGRARVTLCWVRQHSVACSRQRQWERVPQEAALCMHLLRRSCSSCLRPRQASTRSCVTALGWRRTARHRSTPGLVGLMRTSCTTNPHSLCPRRHSSCTQLQAQVGGRGLAICSTSTVTLRVALRTKDLRVVQVGCNPPSPTS